MKIAFFTHARLFLAICWAFCLHDLDMNALDVPPAEIPLASYPEQMAQGVKED